MKIKDLYNQIRDGNIKSDISLQREIVYSEENQVLVIDSLVKGIPLPAFYLWKNNKGILEVLGYIGQPPGHSFDGSSERTLTDYEGIICQEI